MKKAIVLLLIFALMPIMAQAKSYKVIVNDTGNTDIISTSTEKKDANKRKLKVNTGLSNNKCYIKIKANNGKSVRINTPKISSNQYLKLVNVVF